MTQVLLVGNPNCGKTTLFNALTGERQRVGNWPGVTVEQKTGELFLNKQVIAITDLPGIYSLTIPTKGASQDEQIAAKAIVTMAADYIINVVDACHLERHLYLTSQLLELGKPLIVVLNMMDIAEQRGVEINIPSLAQSLGCPVVAMRAHQGIGLPALLDVLSSPIKTPPHLWQYALPMAISTSLQQLETALVRQGHAQQLAHYYAYRLAEGDTCMDQSISILSEICLDPEIDILLADARYQKIHHLVAKVQKKRSDVSEHFTAKLDRIVLHRFWAIPIFLLMMYAMFLFAINIGGAFQDFFDISTETIFVQGSAWLLGQMHTPNWVIALVANGFGRGINTTLTFIPVIAGMFFFLSLLETSGYMARAAFVVDKVMRALGLPGKAFVPMIVGFGCNVPAIMAARTLDSERDRLLTVMMSPFMSCSARLAIYAVFVAAFFPVGGQNVVFSLYLIGIAMAVLTGFLLRKTSLKGHAASLILELPVYHRPQLKRLLKETGMRLRFFIFRAGKLIIPICVILGGLNAIVLGDTVNGNEANAQSLLSILGQWLTPLFSPMGIQQDNWPATVGLLTGMLAKEVVVGTLNALYSQGVHVVDSVGASFDFWGGLTAAVTSIPTHLAELGNALGNPVAASAAGNQLSGSVYGEMVKRFDGQIGAYAYLLFILLYIPCVSTMAVIRQEANKWYMWTSVSWSLVIAYAAAVIFYQSAKLLEHPQHSLFWIATMSIAVVVSVLLFQYIDFTARRTHVIANT